MRSILLDIEVFIQKYFKFTDNPSKMMDELCKKIDRESTTNADFLPDLLMQLLSYYDSTIYRKELKKIGIIGCLLITQELLRRYKYYTNDIYVKLLKTSKQCLEDDDKDKADVAFTAIIEIFTENYKQYGQDEFLNLLDKYLFSLKNNTDVNEDICRYIGDYFAENPSEKASDILLKHAKITKVKMLKVCLNEVIMYLSKQKDEN